MSESDNQHRQFLRRGGHSAAATLPVGPSIIFDESRGGGGGGAVVAVDASQSTPLATPPPSSRRRPRFATAQDLDDALLQAIEGKITRKNAWASKDASNLLEGITHTIESTLEAASASDEYSSFAKVATVVEGCSKVWTSRVDSTYQRSNQMVRRLLRNEEGGAGSEDDADGERGGGDGLADTVAGAAERRKKAAQRRGQTARTLALDPSEINLDSRGRLALAQVGVNAQFRAITEKFDQGNAQGLLLNNAPLGSAGNLILDVDFSRNKDGEPRHSALRSATSARRTSGHVKDEPLDDHNQNGGEENTAVENGEFYSEMDEGLNTRIELPPFPQPIVVEASEQNSCRTSGNVSNVGGGGGGAVKPEETEAGRPSVILPSLLMLPHTLDRDGAEESGDVAGAQQGSFFGSEAHLNGNNQDANDNNDDDYDNGNDDWGDDGAMDYEGGNGESSFMDSTTENDVNSGNASASLIGSNIAAEARNLVTGAAELNALDGCLFGDKRLALEADDPTSWFPLTEPPANAFGGIPHNSELRRLHREHHLMHSATGPSLTPSGVNMNTQNASESAAKKVKREKTIVFDLPGELAASADGSENSIFSFLIGSNAVDNSALKQSATPGKNITPLGKELLLGKDPNAVIAFTQSSVQKKRALEAGLLLPDPPVPGKTIPSYLPYPVAVPVFFQPFSTPLLQWNMLRKSAAGHTLTLASGAPSRRMSGVHAKSGWDERGNAHMLNGHDDDIGAGVDGDDGGLGDMPVEFFHGGAESDDEYMGAGGFNDDYDAHSDGEDSVRLAQEQILRGFERAELARTSGTQTAASRHSGIGPVTTDPEQLVRVLHNAQAALPAQVDVVRLRQAMWTSLREVMKHSPALLDAANREEERIESNRRKGRKRGRAQEEGKGENEDAVDKTQLPHFSDVVMSVLPHVANGISTSGTLSPAFFFFSILFLANEHGVVLESVPGLDDLVIRGFDSSAAAAADGQ